MKRIALRHLAGVGDRSLGEWYEWTGYAYHVRRRLTAVEQSSVGDVVDCRGTDEWERRYAASKDGMPYTAHALAIQERTK